MEHGGVREDEPGAAPLIGIEDIEAPSWARGYEATARAGLYAVTRTAVPPG